jgi:hypothetical protein
MLGTLIKKRISDNQLANIFVNTLLEAVEVGFSEVARLINEDSAFVVSPCIDEKNDEEFAIIVIVGNLTVFESTFDPEQADRIENIIFDKLSIIYQMSKDDFKTYIRNYRNYIQKINHPSKNIIYGMSKAVFHKYNLNNFQDEYFKRIKTPNPLLMKRIDLAISNFIWNWDAFFKKYKIN